MEEDSTGVRGGRSMIMKLQCFVECFIIFELASLSTVKAER